MRVIDKKTAQGFGFTMYYLAFDLPAHTPSRYWLWMQRFSCICIKVSQVFVASFVHVATVRIQIFCICSSSAAVEPCCICASLKFFLASRQEGGSLRVFVLLSL